MKIPTNLQRKIPVLVSILPDKDAFYLTGGTALSAFFIKHRISHELDFFTNVEELILPFSQKFEASLKNANLVLERLRGFHSFVGLSVTSSESSEIPGVKIDNLTALRERRF